MSSLFVELIENEIIGNDIDQINQINQIEEKDSIDNLILELESKQQSKIEPDTFFIKLLKKKYGESGKNFVNDKIYKQVEVIIKALNPQQLEFYEYILRNSNKNDRHCVMEALDIVIFRTDYNKIESEREYWS